MPSLAPIFPAAPEASAGTPELVRVALVTLFAVDKLLTYPLNPPVPVAVPLGKTALLVTAELADVFVSDALSALALEPVLKLPLAVVAVLPQPGMKSGVYVAVPS